MHWVDTEACSDILAPFPPPSHWSAPRLLIGRDGFCGGETRQQLYNSLKTRQMFSKHFQIEEKRPAVSKPELRKRLVFPPECVEGMECTPDFWPDDELLTVSLTEAHFLVTYLTDVLSSLIFSRPGQANRFYKDRCNSFIIGIRVGAWGFLFETFWFLVLNV